MFCPPPISASKVKQGEWRVSSLNISNFIWGIADDVLRDVYVRGKYRDMGHVLVPREPEREQAARRPSPLSLLWSATRG